MMIVAWMAYAMIVGAIIAGAALASERLVEIWGGARRFVWMGAGVLAVVLPIALAARTPARVSRVATRPSSPTFDGPIIELGSVASRSLAGAEAGVRMPRVSLDAAATAAWCLASLILIALILRGFVILQRGRARWINEQVDGCRVLISEDVGPAVVGAVTPRIVIPRWVLSLGEEERRLMLVHESEHIAAGDPRTLLGAALLLALFPWNPALWLIAHRLRLAIEIDCDARVLRAIDRPRDYGLLLLTVGARTVRSLPLAASLAERPALLERRILAMTSLRPNKPLLASLPFIGVVALAATALAQTPAPLPMRHAALAPLVARTSASTIKAAGPIVIAEPAVMPPLAAAATVPALSTIDAGAEAVKATSLLATIAPLPPIVALRTCCDPIPRDSVRAWIERYYPDIAAGDTTHNLIGFSVDESGSVVGTAAATNPKLNDQLETIRAARERVAAENRQGAAQLKIHGQSLIASSDSTSPNYRILAALAPDGTRIQALETASHFAGEVAAGPVQVIIVKLKR